MNIYAKKGDKVRFLNDNGRDSEREYAATMLKEGQVYTVDHTDVYGWHTDVHLQEVPDQMFNSVMFDDVDAKEEVDNECTDIPF